MRGVYSIDLHGWESRILVVFGEFSEPKRAEIFRILESWGKFDDPGARERTEGEIQEILDDPPRGVKFGDSRDSVIWVDDMDPREMRRTLFHECDHHITTFFNAIVGGCKECLMTEPKAIFASVLMDDALAVLEEYLA